VSDIEIKVHVPLTQEEIQVLARLCFTQAGLGDNTEVAGTRGVELLAYSISPEDQAEIIEDVLYRQEALGNDVESISGIEITTDGDTIVQYAYDDEELEVDFFEDEDEDEDEEGC